MKQRKEKNNPQELLAGSLMTTSQRSAKPGGYAGPTDEWQRSQKRFGVSNDCDVTYMCCLEKAILGRRA